MIRSLSDSPFPRRWWHWLVLVLAAELLWFGFMYPLVPRSVPAVAFEALLPLPLLGCMYLAMQGMLWITSRNWASWTKQLLAATLVLGVIAAGIWLIDWSVIHTPIVFSYQLIHRL